MARRGGHAPEEARQGVQPEELAGHRERALHRISKETKEKLQPVQPEVVQSAEPENRKRKVGFVGGWEAAEEHHGMRTSEVEAHRRTDARQNRHPSQVQGKEDQKLAVAAGS